MIILLNIKSSHLFIFFANFRNQHQFPIYRTDCNFIFNPKNGNLIHRIPTAACKITRARENEIRYIIFQLFENFDDMAVKYAVVEPNRHIYDY